MQVFYILLYGIYQLSLVLLNSSTSNLSATYQKRAIERTYAFHTFDRTNNALNLEKTRNISLAFLAAPSRSRSRAMF
jgi:hypothetical protein